MKVYVITQGAYSDYHICGVATDKERATLLSKYYSDGYGLAEVEEYDTEEDIPNSDVLERLTPVYLVRIEKSGKCSSSLSEYKDARDCENKFAFGVCWGDKDTFYAHVATDNEDRARKIAFDKRAQMIAERFGL